MRQITDRVFNQAGMVPPSRWELSNPADAMLQTIAELYPKK